MIKTHLPSFHVIQKQQRFFLFSISECVLELQGENSAQWLFGKGMVAIGVSMSWTEFTLLLTIKLVNNVISADTFPNGESFLFVSSFGFYTQNKMILFVYLFMVCVRAYVCAFAFVFGSLSVCSHVRTYDRSIDMWNKIFNAKYLTQKNEMLGKVVHPVISALKRQRQEGQEF